MSEQRRRQKAKWIRTYPMQLSARRNKDDGSILIQGHYFVISVWHAAFPSQERKMSNAIMELLRGWKP